MEKKSLGAEKDNSVDKEKSCINCSIKNVSLGRCRICKCTYYCGINCQKRDWKIDKEIWKKLKDINTYNILFNSLIINGVPFFKLTKHSYFEIPDIVKIIKSGTLILDECTKMINIANSMGLSKRDGMAINKVPKFFNIYESYVKKIKKLGLEYTESKIEEWKENILNFNILNEIK